MQTLLSRPHTPDLLRRAVLVTLIIGTLTLALCAVVLVRFNGDPLAFTLIGTRFSQGDPAGTTGYDGQFFYFIARDGMEASIPFLDGPTLRLQRIGYPILARIIGLGDPTGVAWAMLGINVIAQAVAAGMIAYLAGRMGGSPFIGLAYGLWIGGMYGVRLGLSEPLALALGIAAVLMYVRGRLGWTVGLLVLSTLTKEIGLVFAAALALHALADRRVRVGLLLGGLPVAVFAAWWAILYARFGTLPTIYPAARDIRFIPFSGLLAETDSAEFTLLVLWIVIPCLLIGLAALWKAIRTRRISLSIALTVCSVGFVAFMPGVSWDDPLAAYRIATPFVIAGALLLAHYRPRWRMVWHILVLSPLLIVPLSPLWLGGA